MKRYRNETPFAALHKNAIVRYDRISLEQVSPAPDPPAARVRAATSVRRGSAPYRWHAGIDPHTVTWSEHALPIPRIPARMAEPADRLGALRVEIVLESGQPARLRSWRIALGRRVRAAVPAWQGLRASGIQHQADRKGRPQHSDRRASHARKTILPATALQAVLGRQRHGIATEARAGRAGLRSVVRASLDAAARHDHKVYITDWIDARRVPFEDGAFHLDDYVEYIQAFIRHIGAKNLHVISVCQPTVPVLAAISLMASRGEDTPRTMTMMGGPIDARKSPTSVNSLATRHSYQWFEDNMIYTVPSNYPGVGRKVYPGFLQHAGFVAMNPERHLKSHWAFFEDLLRGDEDDADTHRRFYDEYNAVQDMAAEYYLETIRIVFQEFRLAEGTWVVNGEPVRPRDITNTALFTIEGELDDISGCGQTRAAHTLCAGIAKASRRHFTAETCGHYGIFSGRRWRTIIYPQIREFIYEHDRDEVAAQA
ncbi:hypothetical protein DFQ30_000970 [Apophysomyces sp. BC1015]|nr:hypothetical protein DFQ30_000970 [Apophysomyces sp. BC1015]